MLEINTIQDYMALDQATQTEILKSIKTKDRLEKYLLDFNNKKDVKTEPFYKKCKRCGTTGWILVEPRNNADIHASQIHRCMKKIWYDCSGYSDQAVHSFSARTRMIFDQGHAIHEMLQTYGENGAFCEKGFYQSEVPIVPDAAEAQSKGYHILPVAQEYRIRSFVDAVNWKYVIQDIPGIGDVSIRIIHEYKSIGSSGFAALQRPKPEHLQQAMLYCACFCVPIVTFIYFDKDRCQIAEFSRAFDPYVWALVTTKIKTILGYVDSKTMPPWEETSAKINPSECESCEYIGICKPPIKVKVKPMVETSQQIPGMFKTVLTN